MFILLISLFVTAQAATTLKLGDLAPVLRDQTWIQGDPIERFEKGRVYVLDFWATTCAPCVKSLPQLGELARRLGDDVRVVGVAAEIDTAESIREYLRERTPPIDFAISLDAGATARRDFLEASGAMGIPTVIVVDRDGRVAYVGHPALLDHPDHGRPLAQIAAGTWRASDAYEAYAADFTARAKQSRRMRGIYTGLKIAAAEENWGRALALVDAGLKVAEGFHRADLELHRAELLAHHLGRGPEAAARLPNVVEALWDNPHMLGRTLELMFDAHLGLDRWDVDLGHRVALRILNLIEFHPNLEYRVNLRDYAAALLPPVAHFYHLVGLPTLAVRYQRRAIESARRGEYDSTDLERELAAFEKSARLAPTNMGEPLCVNERCHLLGPAAAERKRLDALLRHEPGSAAALADQPGGFAESVLFEVATDDGAPDELRARSLEALGRRGSDCVAAYLADVRRRCAAGLESPSRP